MPFLSPLFTFALPLLDLILVYWFEQISVFSYKQCQSLCSMPRGWGQCTYNTIPRIWMCRNLFRTPLVLRWNILGELSQYHGCWCLGCLRRQSISSQGIDSVGYMETCLSPGMNSTTSGILMPRNDWKCKYISNPRKKMTRNGLNHEMIWSPTERSWPAMTCQQTSECLWVNSLAPT